MADALPNITITSTEPTTIAEAGERHIPDETSKTHGRTNSDHLSPPGTGAYNKHFLDPGSPTPTLAGSTDDGSIVVPPSPTLSASSVQFATSVALRDNNPEESTGLSSLALLKPYNIGSRHSRSGSSVSSHISSDGTEPDHHQDSDTLHRVHSEVSMTLADSAAPSVKPSSSDVRKPSNNQLETSKPAPSSSPGSKRQESSGSSTHREIRPIPAENIDPTPFAFKPVQLASLLDPKNLEGLIAMGGIVNVLRGLGTHPTRGLSKLALGGAGMEDSTVHAAKGTARAASDDEKAGHSDKKLDAESTLPGIVVTSPAGEVAEQTRESESLDNDFEEVGPAYGAAMDRRRHVYGENVLPHRPSKTLLQLMWLAFKDKVLILLSIAAVVSLALGLFQDLGPSRNKDHKPVDWVEGVAIMVAIVIVVVVGSVNDWQKERQFQVLNEKTEERGVKVIREGVEHIIDVREVVVGDVALLEPGEIVPCDGIFLSGHNVKCDESGATGESDAIKKASYFDCVALHQKERQLKEEGGPAIEHAVSHTDCFVLSGSKVLEGIGSYIVVAVGQRSFNGRIMMALRGDPENTPLQMKLNDLAEVIAKIGSAAGLLFFVALMIKFFIELGMHSPPRNANENGIAFVNILIIAVTVIVVAVPEGLPLAVTIALAFATKRMTRENLLVRVLGSCETMANASVVCTDKTGTLTQNCMTVVAGSIGIHAKFVSNLAENKSRTNADERDPATSSDHKSTAVESRPRKHPKDFSLDQSQLNTVLSPQLRTLLNESICINSTAFEDRDPETGEMEFVGSKTETALLQFAKEFGWPDYKKTRDAAKVVQVMPFSSQRKAMGIVIRHPSGKHTVLFKGASEILTKRCTRHVVVSNDVKDHSDSQEPVLTAEIDDTATDNIQRTIIFYANQTLRTIAACYRDFDSWPPEGAHYTDVDEVDYEYLAQDLTLIGIFGIEDPLRPGVREAVGKCQRAGVAVKMCTGDNVLTARSIAMQCGIYSAGGIIMEGPVFRQLSDNYMLAVVPRLQVLARSSPEDKKILVEKLKELGEVVGVTGDGTNDGPALKTANVGFAMGIAGTEVAKEASDIILMDDNFASIVKAIMWGRCVNDSVRKFLQFQLSTNVTAVVVTIVSALAADKSEQSVLTAVQLLWVNIIMDTFAALALATDYASEELLNRKPDSKTAPLFTVDMYKQIFFQSFYQVAVTLVFYFLGKQILGFSSNSDLVAKTFIFNAFVFAQIFNSLNCRRLDRHLNVFEGVLRNYFFLGITLIEFAVQILIVFVGGAAFQVTPLPGREWGISIALGFVSVPLGALVRLLPNAPFERLFKLVRLLPRRSELLPTTQPEWSPAIEKVKDGLRTFVNLRGGRLRSSSFVVKSRSAQVPKAPPPRISALLTMIPTLVVSGVTTNWKQQVGSLSDPASTDPSKSSAALFEGHGEVHPDTKPDDPAYRLLGVTKAPA